MAPDSKSLQIESLLIQSSRYGGSRHQRAATAPFAIEWMNGRRAKANRGSVTFSGAKPKKVVPDRSRRILDASAPKLFGANLGSGWAMPSFFLQVERRTLSISPEPRATR